MHVRGLNVAAEHTLRMGVLKRGSRLHSRSQQRTLVEWATSQTLAERLARQELGARCLELRLDPDDWVGPFRTAARSAIAIDAPPTS